MTAASYGKECQSREWRKYDAFQNHLVLTRKKEIRKGALVVDMGGNEVALVSHAAAAAHN
jgi:hypothetical protein